MRDQWLSRFTTIIRITTSDLAQRAEILALVAAICVWIGQMWFICTAWTPVGFVDTWPLYERLVAFRSGTLSLDHYLLDPHGLHLHSIVYFLYLVDALLSSGRQIVPHWASIVSMVGTAVCIVYVFSRSRDDQPTWSAPEKLFMVLAPVLLCGISEATVLPFQSVVIVSRFAYVIILCLLVYALTRPKNRGLYLITLLLAVISAGFYGSSGLFAAEVLLVHFVLRSSWRRVLLSAAPLLTHLLLVRTYIDRNNREAIEVAAVLRNLDGETAGQLVLGAIAYYGAGLTPGWPTEVTLQRGPSISILWLVSSVLLAVSAIWSIIYLAFLWRRLSFEPRAVNPKDWMSSVVALLGIFTLASSFSASLLWVARARIFGSALGMPSHHAVLTSSRYAAFSALATIVVAYISVTIVPRKYRLLLTSVLFCFVVALGWNSLLNRSRQVSLAPLEVASTAMLMGLSPVEPEASPVWPGVGGDAFWSARLPVLISNINAAGISYANGLPALGQRMHGRTERVAHYTVGKAAPGRAICPLTGFSASFRGVFSLTPDRIFAVVNGSGEVIGYAARSGSRIEGYCHCNATDPGTPSAGVVSAAQARERMPELPLSNLTDANWRNGVWIQTAAAMFLTPEGKGSEKLVPGAWLTFAKSGPRRVVRTGGQGLLAIEVEGSSLDPVGDGFPNEVKIGVWRQPEIFLVGRQP